MTEEQFVVNSRLTKKSLPLWLRIILFSGFGLSLAVGLFLTGYKLGRKRTQIISPPTLVPPTPTSTLTLKPAFNTEENIIKDSLVVFDRNEKIFLLDGLNSQPIELVEGEKPSLFSDRSKIAFVKMDKDNNIHIYEIKTGKTETLITDEGRLRSVSWSSNGKYLITDSGTDIEGTGAVYEYPAGRKISSFYNSCGKIAWVNDEEFVFDEPQEVFPPRPWGSGNSSGLSKITLPTGEKQSLAKANALEGFGFLKTEDEIIYFAKESVESPDDDWLEPGKVKTSYWQMKSNGQEIKEIGKLETLREKVAKELPEEFHIFSDPVPHYADTNWVIFDINNKEGYSVCIMNLENPKNTFRQITTGTHPSW